MTRGRKRSDGVSGGYSPNLLLGAVDPLLAGISEEADNQLRRAAGEVSPGRLSVPNTA